MVTPTLAKRRRLRKWRLVVPQQEWAYESKSGTGPRLRLRFGFTVHAADAEGREQATVLQASALAEAKTEAEAVCRTRPAGPWRVAERYWAWELDVPGSPVVLKRAFIVEAPDPEGPVRTTVLQARTWPEAKAEAEQILFGQDAEVAPVTRVPCEICGKPLTGMDSQWSAHKRTHRPDYAPSRPGRWRVLTPWRQWQYDPTDPDYDGPRVLLTRLKEQVNVPPRFQLTLTWPRVGGYCWDLEASCVHAAQAQVQAEQLFARYRHLGPPEGPPTAVEEPDGS